MALPPPPPAPDPARPAVESPHSVQAEQAVLGACLIYPECVHDVGDLQPGEFFLIRHVRIFRAILEAHADSGATDPICVGDVLERQGVLGDVGGIDYLYDLQELAVVPALAHQHAEIIRAKARLRAVSDAAQMAILGIQTGEDFSCVCEKLRSAVDAQSNGRTHLRVRDWMQLAVDPPAEWLVEGMLPRQGVGIFAGSPSTGKTLVTMDLALRAAHGMDWMGRRVRQISTLVWAGEGISGNRIRAWAKTHETERQLEGRYVQIIDGAPDLTKPAGVAEMREAMEMMRRTYGSTPGLVVIDTLAIAMPGSDENDAGAAGLLMRALGRFSRDYRCMVLLLHHLRKSQPGTHRGGADAVRGSGALVGAADVVWLATRESSDTMKLAAEKLRDGHAGVPVYYGIRGVDTGSAHEDGRIEYGPVPFPCDAPQQETSDAALEQVVDVLARVGGCASRSRIVAEMSGMARSKKFQAIQRAVDAGVVSEDPATKLLRTVDGSEPVPNSSRTGP